MKPLRLSGMDHTVLPTNNTMPASTSKVFTRWRHHWLWSHTSNCSLLLIDWPHWLAYPYKWSPVSCSRAQDRTGKVCRTKTSILPQPLSCHVVGNTWKVTCVFGCRVVLTCRQRTSWHCKWLWWTWHWSATQTDSTSLTRFSRQQKKYFIIWILTSEQHLLIHAVGVIEKPNLTLYLDWTATGFCFVFLCKLSMSLVMSACGGCCCACRPWHSAPCNATSV